MALGIFLPLSQRRKITLKSCRQREQSTFTFFTAPDFEDQGYLRSWKGCEHNENRQV